MTTSLGADNALIRRRARGLAEVLTSAHSGYAGDKSDTPMAVRQYAIHEHSTRDHRP